VCGKGSAGQLHHLGTCTACHFVWLQHNVRDGSRQSQLQILCLTGEFGLYATAADAARLEVYGAALKQQQGDS
jgi:hypothetical protein